MCISCKQLHKLVEEEGIFTVGKVDVVVVSADTGLVGDDSADTGHNLDVLVGQAGWRAG